MITGHELPLITNIKKFSFDDGPGIRTTIFLKGCPLRCNWCHNPENYELGVTIGFDKELCIGCGKCNLVCSSGALKKFGEKFSPLALSDIILKYKTFYDSSCGGVTFSGGEPLMHIEYISSVVDIIKEHKINILLQTAGYFNYDLFNKYLIKKVHTVFFDLKIFDSIEHKKQTGVGNELILENFKKIVKSGVVVVPRIPMIPHITDTVENLKQIMEFLDQFDCVNLSNLIRLPFNSSYVKKHSFTSREESEVRIQNF